MSLIDFFGGALTGGMDAYMKLSDMKEKQRAAKVDEGLKTREMDNTERITQLQADRDKAQQAYNNALLALQQAQDKRAADAAQTALDMAKKQLEQLDAEIAEWKKNAPNREKMTNLTLEGQGLTNAQTRANINATNTNTANNSQRYTPAQNKESELIDSQIADIDEQIKSLRGTTAGQLGQYEGQIEALMEQKRALRQQQANVFGIRRMSAGSEVVQPPQPTGLEQAIGYSFGSMDPRNITSSGPRIQPYAGGPSLASQRDKIFGNRNR